MVGGITRRLTASGLGKSRRLPRRVGTILNSRIGLDNENRGQCPRLSDDENWITPASYSFQKRSSMNFHPLPETRSFTSAIIPGCPQA